MTSKTRIAAPGVDQLLRWYDQNRRELPWRSAPGLIAEPYKVWLSEIMLQQTTVATVGPYFDKFIARWPTLQEFAASDLDDVLHMWAGLGYYARARNLHKCAQVLQGEFGGAFPKSQKELLTLPGIGPYSSAAIAAIAFDQQAVVVDGNVERVMARIFAVEDPVPRAKPKLKSLAGNLTPAKRPGDYAQAVMDLGAMICKPRNPLCRDCPWQQSCQARHKGIEQNLPRKTAKTPKPTRRGVAFWVQREDGKILLRKRPPSGLLGAMIEIPSSPWIEQEKGTNQQEKPEKSAPFKGRWRKNKCKAVRHTFTHFHLEIDIWLAQAKRTEKLTNVAEEQRCRWVHIAELDSQALPTLMRKIAASAVEGSSRSLP